MECRAYAIRMDSQSGEHLGKDRKVSSAAGGNLSGMHKTEKTVKESRMNYMYSHLCDGTLGNFPPGDPKLRDQGFHTSRRYLTDPWSKATIERLSEPGDILILGSGLTGLDLLLSLAKSRRAGMIHLVSRRGLFPQPHASCAPCPSLLDVSTLPKTAREALNQVRKASQRATEAGSDWRAVIDGLRPSTQNIWRQWDWAERRRFLRHLRA